MRSTLQKNLEERDKGIACIKAMRLLYNLKTTDVEAIDIWHEMTPEMKHSLFDMVALYAALLKTFS